MEDSPIPERWELDDWKFKRCPLKIITKESIEYLEAYKFFKLGFLPNDGGWLSQTNAFLDAMRIVDSEIHKMTMEKQNA